MRTIARFGLASLVAWTTLSLLLTAQAAAQADASAPGGIACTDADECDTGHCTDGYCCDVSCGGGCGACDGADRGLDGATNGICAVLPAGSVSPLGCGPYVCDGESERCPSGCVTDEQCITGAYCDTAASLCTYNTDCENDDDCGPSRHCRDGMCAADLATGGPCDSDGQCKSEHCVADFCRALCVIEADCSFIEWCNEGVCVPNEELGTACADDGHCGSGFCRDGVCCEEDCADTCMACSAEAKGEGEDGTCGFVVHGNNPNDDCEGASGSCSSGFVCDGAGACECAGSCDENGHTLLSGSDHEDCAPYRCVENPAATCLAECDSSSDCASGARCTRGECVEDTPQDSAPTDHAPAADDSSGCSLTNADRDRSLPWWALAALSLLAARRRNAPTG